MVRKRKRNRLVYGVGVNDSDCPIVDESGNLKIEYKRWKDMLMRCYSKSYPAKHPTYVGSIVCDEWLRYSNFKKWCDTWVGIDSLQLDKNLVGVDNKIYSPSTCFFVPRILNSNIMIRADGVYKAPNSENYSVYIGQFGKQKYLCSHKSKKYATVAYLKARIEYLGLLMDDLASSDYAINNPEYFEQVKVCVDRFVFSNYTSRLNAIYYTESEYQKDRCPQRGLKS